jgi:hypothetical protein
LDPLKPKEKTKMIGSMRKRTWTLLALLLLTMFMGTVRKAEAAPRLPDLVNAFVSGGPGGHTVAGPAVINLGSGPPAVEEVITLGRFTGVLMLTVLNFGNTPVGMQVVSADPGQDFSVFNLFSVDPGKFQSRLLVVGTGVHRSLDPELHWKRRYCLAA